MDASAKLTITKRVKGSKGAMHRLRREGLLPGSISRKGHDAVSFSVNKVDFRKAFSANGMSGIYTLQADKKTVFTAMIREIQYAPGSDDFLHITLQVVSLTEETTADITLHIIGREEVHHNGFELIQQLESVHLRGLPGKFPTAVEVDVSAMKPGEQLIVGELKLPDGITCQTEEDRLVLSVSHPKIKEEEPEEEQEQAVEQHAEPGSDDTQAQHESGE